MRSALEVLLQTIEPFVEFVELAAKAIELATNRIRIDLNGGRRLRTTSDGR